MVVKNQIIYSFQAQEFGRRIYIQEDTIIQAFHRAVVSRPHDQRVNVDVNLVFVIEESRKSSDLFVVLLIQCPFDDYGDEVKNFVHVDSFVFR